MLDRVDLVGHVAARGIHGDLIAFHFTDQCASDGRVHRNQISLGVCLIFSNDAVRHGAIVIDIDQCHRYAEDDLTCSRDGGDVDDLSVGQLVLELLNTPLSKALLLSCSVVLSVLF